MKLLRPKILSSDVVHSFLFRVKIRNQYIWSTETATLRFIMEKYTCFIIVDDEYDIVFPIEWDRISYGLIFTEPGINYRMGLYFDGYEPSSEKLYLRLKS